MSCEKQAQALAQPPGLRCSPAEIWQNMGVGRRLGELGVSKVLGTAGL